MKPLDDFLDKLSGWEQIESLSGPARAVRRIAQLADRPPKVIEIGTAFGEQLNFFADLCERVVCIDPMYDWIPDVPPNEPFDKARIDLKKINQWTRNATKSCELIIGSSFEVTKERKWNDIIGLCNDVIIVDGCHHPKEAVARDYETFLPHMCQCHYVIFDDIQYTDCKKGAEMALSKVDHDQIDLDHGSIKVRIAFVRGPKT